MTSLAQRLTEDRRGIILRSLNEDPGFTMAEMTLKRVLDIHGHVVSTSELRADLEWLERAVLVRVDRHEMRPDVWTWSVQLLDEGQVVARGRSHPGVAQSRYAPSSGSR